MSIILLSQTLLLTWSAKGLCTLPLNIYHSLFSINAILCKKLLSIPLDVMFHDMCILLASRHIICIQIYYSPCTKHNLWDQMKIWYVFWEWREGHIEPCTLWLLWGIFHCLWTRSCFKYSQNQAHIEPEITELNIVTIVRTTTYYCVTPMHLARK